MRYDVVVKVKGSGDREFSRKVGAAFPHRNGGGMDVVLDFPIGVQRLTLFPADEGSGSGQRRGSGSSDPDDPMPF